jgi:electron transfer flavoprotein beta subunit
MKVVVCLKRVPDTTTKVRIAADGRSLDATGVEWILGPYDEIALERALQLREAGAATRVTALCLGPKEASKEVRTALAMGADDGLLLVEAGGDRDAASVAAALAGALAELAPDLVLLGWKAIDSDAASVPALVAEALGRPCVTFATKLEPEAGGLRIHREIEGGTEVVSVPLPCVVTAQKGLAEPRYASLKGIMAAKKKPLVEKPAPAAAAAARTLRLELPPVRPAGRIVPGGVAAVPELVRLLREEARLL